VPRTFILQETINIKQRALTCPYIT